LIRLASPIAIIVLVAAIVCGAVVGLSGAKITADATRQITELEAAQAAAEQEKQAVEAELETAQAERERNESDRDALQRRYDKVGSRVEALEQEVRDLRQYNRELSAQYESLPTAPDVIGMDSYFAGDYLEGQGFSWYRNSTSVEGSCDDYRNPYLDLSRVVSQSPSAGTRMQPGSYVTFFTIEPYATASIFCLSY
jgi:beta-lactam-binding protein with PASTA domain